MKFEFSAGGVVYKKTPKGNYKIALIKDPFDKWTFPKGLIEKEEKPLEAAERECKEELGLSSLEFLEKLAEEEFFYRWPPKSKKPELRKKKVYYFLFRAPSNSRLKPQLKEIKTAKWFDLNKVINLLGYKTLKPIFEKAKKRIQNG